MANTAPVRKGREHANIGWIDSVIAYQTRANAAGNTHCTLERDVAQKDSCKGNPLLDPIGIKNTLIREGL